VLLPQDVVGANAFVGEVWTRDRSAELDALGARLVDADEVGVLVPGVPDGLRGAAIV
jgi:hypothetical protein